MHIPGINIHVTMFQFAPNTSVLELLEYSDSDNDDGTDQITEQTTHTANVPATCRLSIIDRVKEFLVHQGQNEDQEQQPNVVYEHFLSDNLYSEHEIKQVEELTKGQTNNPEWHKFRKGLITASNFKRVYTRTKTLQSSAADPSPLLDHLMGRRTLDEDHLPAAIAWGRDHEADATKLYVQLNKHMHKNLTLKSTGLILDKACPFLGCSPDGIATCQCDTHAPTTWLIEVKCPHALKDMHPYEAARQRGCALIDGVWHLEQSHPYYTQIQGQLGISGVGLGVLLVYTKQGILPVDIPFQKEFYEDLKIKLEYFARNFLFGHLVENCKLD